MIGTQMVDVVIRNGTMLICGITINMMKIITRGSKRISRRSNPVVKIAKIGQTVKETNQEN